jgi:glutaredoxin
MNPKAQVVLYSKPGCHLCEVMKVEIENADCEELYDLAEINIETDEALRARYRYEIPVLMINGVEVFRHRLSAADLRRSLEKVFAEAPSRVDTPA